jgi:predicted DNA-binding ribbon-helix-helix protein
MSRRGPIGDAVGVEDDHDRLHFRVLSIGGARKGFRLEMIYWQALDVLAARNGRNLAAEVQARLAGAPEGVNHSSVLRASIAADLMGAWKQAEAEALRPDWSAMIAALPSPAFLVSRRSVLLAVNEPLLSMLQSLRSEPGLPWNTIQGALTLSVQVPPAGGAELASGHRRFVICTVVFSGGGGQRIACPARLIPVHGADVQSANLLGLVENGF